MSYLEHNKGGFGWESVPKTVPSRGRNQAISDQHYTSKCAKSGLKAGAVLKIVPETVPVGRQIDGVCGAWSYAIEPPWRVAVLS